LVCDESLKAEIINCIQKKNLHELEKACTNAGISEETTAKLGCLVKLSGDFAPTLKKAREYVLNEKMKQALDELETITCTDTSNMRLDFSIINDMSYYNGVIFRGYVAPVPKAVLSGGRYDNLLEKMGKRNLCAIGFAVYYDEFERYFKSASAQKTDYVILYNDKTDLDTLCNKVNELSQKGSVLVAEQLPDGIEYSQTEDLRK
jgi:ATP phosphoribosyltransferase regulatory subunit